jgi:cytochrome b
LAAAFAVAYLTAEELEDVHVAAGYWIGAYVIARTAWGFVGSRHARFSDFVRGPRAVFGYLSDLLRGKPAYYVGHNPAGGAMIVALLLGLAATVFTGLLTQADAENEGPLSPWFGHPTQTAAASTPTALPSMGGEGSGPASPTGAEEKEADSPYAEAHALFANLTLGLIVLHLLGVLAGSLVHKENLPLAMIRGYKPGHERDIGPGKLHPPAKV